VDLGGRYYNTKDQVSALESLLGKLPDLSASHEARTADVRESQAARRPPGEELIGGYQAGATVYELAERFGVSRQTVSRILHRNEVPMRMGGLSPAQINEAVLLYEAGWSLARIGNQMEVNPQTVLNRLRERGVRKHDAWERER
jgi:DNA-binding CsgD family transcriptional regulator